MNNFQLPSWLVNGEPIPEELLAKRSSHSIYQYVNNDDDDDDDDIYKPSSFYEFSFIELSGSSEDTWSTHSSNVLPTTNKTIRDEIKTYVDTLNTCLNQFRDMNEEINNDNQHEEIDDNVQMLLNELIQQIENENILNSVEQSSINVIQLDFNLLNELFTKKLTFNEYLFLLDRLIDNNILEHESKTGEELSHEILILANEIEHYKTIVTTNHNDIDQNSLNSNLYHQGLLSNTQSNYSIISFLQQSTSMDMSLLSTNDFSSQLQANLIASTAPQPIITSAEKKADVGMYSYQILAFRFDSKLIMKFIQVGTIISKRKHIL